MCVRAILRYERRAWRHRESAEHQMRFGRGSFCSVCEPLSSSTRSWRAFQSVYAGWKHEARGTKRTRSRSLQPPRTGYKVKRLNCGARIRDCATAIDDFSLRVCFSALSHDLASAEKPFATHEVRSQQGEQTNRRSEFCLIRNYFGAATQRSKS